jgi:hypothetical protein
MCKKPRRRSESSTTSIHKRFRSSDGARAENGITQRYYPKCCLDWSVLAQMQVPKELGAAASINR